MIYLSSAAVNSSSIEEAVSKLAGFGIHNIELSGGTEYCPNILTMLESYKKKYSLNFLIHNYFPPVKKDFVLNIASNKKKTRLNSVNFVKRSIDLAHDLEIDRYTLHPGYSKNFYPSSNNNYFIPDDSPDISPELAFTIMLKSILMIKEYAEEKGVKIGLENLYPTSDAPKSSLLCTPNEIKLFLEYFDKEDSIGFLLDLGHIVISANYFGFNKDDLVSTLCTKYFHKVFGIHLSGNDGKKDSHTLLSPDCWQLRTARKFDLEKTPITIECRGFNSKEILKQYQMVKNILEKEV